MADAIVVISGSMNLDGTLTDQVRNRVEHGVKLLQAELAPRIIFVGQFPILEFATYLETAADAMARYARELGVPADRILLEERSRDTPEDAYFTRILLLEPNRWNDIILVSNQFHMKRALHIFEHILGSDYHILASGAPDDFTPEMAAETAKKEEDLIVFANSFLDGIEPGNLDQIREMLVYRHPVRQKWKKG